jgi:hypothetical protein
MLLIDMLTEYGGGRGHRVALVAVATEATLLGLASSTSDEVHGVMLKDVSHGGVAGTRWTRLSTAEGCAAVVVQLQDGSLSLVRDQVCDVSDDDCDVTDDGRSRRLCVGACSN